MIADTFFTYKVDRGVAHLILDRPEKFNALSKDMIVALSAKFDEIEADTSVRVVILAAHGKAFSAGHDLTEMLDDLSQEAMRELFGNCADMMQKIIALPQPVIACINGIATAAGCQLAATCDLAVASTKSKFAVSGINVGLFCATPMVAISRVMPPKIAFEMLVTGDFISAEAAAQYGLINKAVPEDELDATVEALARKIASKSPESIAIGKGIFYGQQAMEPDAAYKAATSAIVKNVLLDETQAGIKAFATKQPVPDWKDRTAAE